METEDNVEVTCIVFAKQRIFAAGWNKKVTVYVDGVDNEVKESGQGGHKGVTGTEKKA